MTDATQTPEFQQAQADHEAEQERDPNGPDHITRADINEALDALAAVADCADAVAALAVSFLAQFAGKQRPNNTPPGPAKRR